eukprot:TRINITY_DN16355_c0_g1_i3.p1 TRINITY_DN16355_c0_g1~~TRINITY_DN16355_c0_g1_i3.p1  ORF type:complete len:212 (+),score=16.62 TRINITY_DN16355_c0_g1_i3:69-638(+)
MALGPPRRLDNAEILRVMAGAGVRHFGDAAAPPQRLPPQPSSGLARQDGVGATADGLERRSSAVSSRFRSTAGSSGGEALFAALPRSTGRATNPYLSLPGAAHAPNAHLPFARPPSRVPQAYAEKPLCGGGCMELANDQRRGGAGPPGGGALQGPRRGPLHARCRCGGRGPEGGYGPAVAGQRRRGGGS